MALPATADFTGTNGTAVRTLTNWDGARNYLSIGGAFEIQGNAAQSAPGGSAVAAADWWTGDTFDNDQYSEATVTARANGVYSGVAVRCSGTDNGSNVAGYFFYSAPDDGCYLEKYVNGSFIGTLAGPGTAFAVNDVIRIEIEGNAITCTVNGTSRLTYTDSSSPITSGRAGICTYAVGASSLDNWEGGDVGAAATYTGSGSVSLPALTASGSGTYTAATYTGSGSVSLPALTASGTGIFTALSIVQSAYRFYADDGAEGAATALAAQSTGVLLAPGTRARLRIQIDAASGNPPASAFRLDYRRHDGSAWGDWTPVPVESTEMLLSVSSTNGRYVVDGNGDPVILTGFHTWGNVQDAGTSDPPAAFGWTDYLAALTSRGLNFTKLWTFESPRGWGRYRGIMRYARPGPGTAADGKDKFDVTEINQAWLTRLRSRAEDCRAAGIWACVQLFQGWDIEDKGIENSWTYHPYRAENNINSLDGDVNNDGDGEETQEYSGNPALSIQKTLIEAVIDELNDLDNIFYEISNEPSGGTANTDWQYDLISHIQTYEATKQRQHLILMTVQYPSGSNTVLDNSDAELASYSNRDVTDGTKVSMSDTDHIEGLTNAYTWIWESLTRGHGGLWYMDSWDGSGFDTDTRANSTYILIRDNLGYAATLIGLLIDLEAMTPQAALCSTGYCLARDHATAAEYVCANVNALSSFTLNLSTATGTLNVRWLNCATGATSTTTVAGGATRTLTPPWSGVNVAYIRHGSF